MLVKFINLITPYLSALGHWAYLIVFIWTILETLILIGFIFPWTTIIIIVSFLSVQIWINPRIIFFYAFIWSLIWSNINYFTWRYFKNYSYKKLKIFNFKESKKFRDIMHNNPIKALVFWRLIPWLKESNSFLAWIMGINYYKFLLYSIIWNIIWGLAFIWIPYLFSYSLDVAQMWLDKFTYFIFVLFLIGVFFSLFKLLISKYWKNIIKIPIYIFSLIWNFLLKQKLIKNFIINNPKIILFLKNRIKKEEFVWLPLTILSVLIIYTILAFFWLIEEILNYDLIVGLDYRLASFFYAFRNDFLVNIFLWITSLWREYIIIGFFIIVSLYLYVNNKINKIIALLVSVLWSIWLDSLLKVVFHHTRPEYGVYLEKSYSFPSNHASIAVAFYGFLFWLVIRNTKRWKTKINYLFLWLLLIFLIWFSRLYLWVHYLSDVLGWYLIWGIWLFFSIWLTEFLDIKYKWNWPKYKIKLNKNVVNLLFVVVILLYFIGYNIFNPYIIIDSNIEYKDKISIRSVEDIFINPYLKYSQSFLWHPTENINFIFLAKNDMDIKNIFEKINWDWSDKLNYKSTKSMVKNLLFQDPYDKAPISPIFWNNRNQDFSFQKLLDDKNIRYRHHIRIWKTNYLFNWFNVYIWVWVFDAWLKWHITHKIDPDINKEREYIFTDLNNAKLIESYKKIIITEKFSWKNIYWDNFFSDWTAYFIKLK